MDVPNYDVVVIGAGPTGLMAALQAASVGKRVLVLEKRPAFEERDQEQTRYQAIIIDEQTLLNLQNVGVDVSQDRFPEIDHANFYSSTQAPPTVIPYHAMPTKLKGPSSDDLNLLAFRRKIVALSSITSIENALHQLVTEHPSIDCQFNQDIQYIFPCDTLEISTASQTIQTEHLAICDGAQSDKHGALKLLDIKKRRLPHIIDIAIGKFSDSTRAGELTIQEINQYSEQRHTALFGLSDETVIYCSLPSKSSPSSDQVDQDRDSSQWPELEQTLSSAAASLGMNAEMSAPPAVFQQQAGMVNQLGLDKRIFVLGDAAQSGTAVLGVYFNKGIFDAVAFGQSLCTGNARRFRLRSGNLAARTLLIEEYLIGEAWDKPFATLTSNLFGRHLADALPRSLFRLKAGRHSLARTLAVNTADTMATLSRGLADTLPNDGLRKTSRQAAIVWQALQNSLSESKS